MFFYLYPQVSIIIELINYFYTYFKRKIYVKTADSIKIRLNGLKKNQLTNNF